MEPVKALIFGIDDLFPQLKPYYDREVEKGNLEIVGYAVLENDKIFLIKNLQGEPLQDVAFQKIIISSQNNFMLRFKAAKEIFNNSRGGDIVLNNAIDGRIFQMPGFDFPRFYLEEIAYSENANSKFSTNGIHSIHTRIFNLKDSTILLGTKSYIEGVTIEGSGLIQIGNFSSLSWNIVFELALDYGHVYNYVLSYAMTHLDWIVYKDFYPQRKYSEAILIIGSDVWIGRGCKLKVSNLDKPLVIGNGAVIASDSVVVKDVPPFAIVGGNPAKFIKWRFDREIIEALERIAWWNWDLEKIYDNFHLFNNPEEFVKKFDPQK